MKTAVIYARHVTYRDYEPSVEQQIGQFTDYAQREALEIVGTYSDCFDDKQRVYPDFEKLLRDAKTATWDVILFHSLPIFGRDRKKTYSVLQKLRRYGKTVIFVAHANDPTSETLKSIWRYFYENSR